MEINLTLKFDYVKIIFANEEYKLLTGEKIYFSKRQMLTDIYNQLSEECRTELIKICPMVFDLLGYTNMVRQ
jgi:hypothetical protein